MVAAWWPGHEPGYPTQGSTSGRTSSASQHQFQKIRICADKHFWRLHTKGAIASSRPFFAAEAFITSLGKAQPTADYLPQAWEAANIGGKMVVTLVLKSLEEAQTMAARAP
jgi:hypothetical protein